MESFKFDCPHEFRTADFNLKNSVYLFANDSNSLHFKIQNEEPLQKIARSKCIRSSDLYLSIYNTQFAY